MVLLLQRIVFSGSSIDVTTFDCGPLMMDSSLALDDFFR